MMIDYGKELQNAYNDGYKDRDAEIVRCKDCIHRTVCVFVDDEDVRFNVCELNHNKVQADDWFCADGERKDQSR